MKQSQYDAIKEERARRKELKAREAQGGAAPMDVDEEDDLADDEADDEAQAVAMQQQMAQIYDAGQGMDDDLDGLFGGPDDDED